jgi:hypothetical protein
MKRDFGKRNVRGNAILLKKDNVSLGDFATKRTFSLLSHLNICQSFLIMDSFNWNENNDFR